jgi:hypothetical protein
VVLRAGLENVGNDLPQPGMDDSHPLGGTRHPYLWQVVPVKPEREQSP